MKLFIRIRKFFCNIPTKNIILIISIHAVIFFISFFYIFFNFKYLDNKSEEEFVKYNLYNVTSKFFSNVIEEKMITEIGLNIHDKKDLNKFENYNKISNSLFKEIKKFCSLYDYDFIKLFYKNLNNININIKKIIDKAHTDLKRERSILNISDWSVFFNTQIELLNSLLSGIVSNNYYSYIKLYLFNIINILYKQFTLYSIVLEKNADDIVDIFFSYSMEQVKSNIKSIENIISCNSIDDDLKDAFSKIHDKIDNFYKNIKNFTIINENDFLEDDMKEIKSFLNDIISLESEYLTQNKQTKDILIINKYNVIRYVIFLFFVLLSELVLLLILNHKTISKSIIKNSNNKNIINNEELKINNVPNKLKNEVFGVEQDLLKKEIQFFISNAKNNIIKISEKLRVITLNVNKIHSFGINNINNNSEKKFINYTEKVADPTLKNLNLQYDQAIYSECINIFDKFQELSYRADIIKNIFIEIISELKVTYMSLNIQNSADNKDIIRKIDLLLKNVIEKSSEIKFYNNESKNTYKKIQDIISAIVKEHRYNMEKYKEFIKYIDSTPEYVMQINKSFSSIYNHYGFIINSSDKMQNDLVFLKEHVSDIVKQISFIDSKIKKIFSK